ncbi:aldo/keto reductase [Caproicibacter sp. BJN0012]|uniref:aldo/keto reductase n=1 Tax=Caproicibacter sp. BJN0012 TaxID=3110227 RepID=UPI002E1114A5
MNTVKLGKTNLVVNKNGFGALPIQRVDKKNAVRILRKAFDGGINYYDSARAYSDSEEKLGAAFSWVRDQIVISTKTAAGNAEGFWKDLEQSLRDLRTDYIDIYQFHNPDFCPRPGDESGLYDAMLKAQAQGKIRFIGITNHRLSVAKEAADSGLYDTIQFPFSYLSTGADLKIVEACRDNGIGFIAMKALSGGLITDSAMAYAYLEQFDNVEPIWGIQRGSELDEFLSYQDRPPALSEEMKRRVESDRKELAGEFCRGCGYCMPCPAEISINTCARMSLLLRRAPQESYLSEKWQKEMKKIENCLHCNQCMSKCPYGLNTPDLLKKNYEDYQTFLKPVCQ